MTSAVHFAAYKNVGEIDADPGKYWHNNVDGTVHLVDALLEAGVRDLVFSSSCSVYGNAGRVPVDESAPIAPESVYAETKATMERIFALVRRHHGPARREPALLQRRRRQPRRRDRRGLDPLAEPRPARDEGRARAAPARAGLRRRLPDARRHLRSATTSTSRISPTPTSARSTTSPPAARRGAFNVGTGVGSSVMEVIRATAADLRPAGALRDRQPPRGRPGDDLRRPDPRRGTILGWTPRVRPRRHHHDRLELAQLAGLTGAAGRPTGRPEQRQPTKRRPLNDAR